MKVRLLFTTILLLVVLTGCGLEEKDPLDNKITIGVMLSENGLGDQSFSDLAFAGLVQARDEDDVIIEYLELADTGTYGAGFEQLVNNNNDLVIAVGFSGQEDLEKVASQHPEKSFILVDGVSESKNITSITFKEDEGSLLAGVVAATVSQSQTIGFIGGMEIPVIERFQTGFIEGAKMVNPEIEVLTAYTNDFDDDKIGASTAAEMIAKDADVLYAAAGFAGVGMLKEAERSGIYAIGADSDQYFFAENAVITSMMKNINVALFDIIHEYKEVGEIPTGHIDLGLAENGVGLAPFRVLDLSDTELKQLENKLEEISSQMN